MFNPKNWQLRIGVLSVMRTAAYAIATGVGILTFVHLIFYAFPLTFRMASNADSLVMLDFARDLLLGHSIAHWNLPRVPYLFPDAVIALGIMVVGWVNPWSFYLIAGVHYAALLYLALVVLRESRAFIQLRYWQAGVLMSLSLLTIGIVLPGSFGILFWQLFASGAHFLSAMVVLAMLLAAQYWQSSPSAHRVLAILFLLAIAEGVSNSMAALLLGLWCASQFAVRRIERTPLRLDLIVVFAGILIGSALSTLIPRQSLVDSFFSIDKFVSAAHAFFAWLIAAPSHLALIVALVCGVLFYPFLIARYSDHPTRSIWVILKSPVLWPSVGVMLATPLFFQEAGSIRYVAFPALITLLSVSAIYGRFWQWVQLRPGRYRLVILVVTVFAALAGWQLMQKRMGPHMNPQAGKDFMGLAAGAQTDLALACLRQAKAQLLLQDGIATYWNARPTRFATQFEYFFAQINPWRPRSGYMVWGNNPIDFVYRDLPAKTPRQYNFVLATQDEIEQRLWGSLPSVANQTVVCEQHRILYFDDPTILWNFLFPLEVPYGFRTHDLEAKGDGIARNSSQSTGAIRIFPADDFLTMVGKRDGTQLQATGVGGTLAYGPYIPLAAGRYQLIAHGQLNHPAGMNAVLDVSTQFGKIVIAQTPVPLPKTIPMNQRAPTIAQIVFELTHTTNDVEFRLQIPNGTQGVLSQFSLQRLD